MKCNPEGIYIICASSTVAGTNKKNPVNSLIHNYFVPQCLNEAPRANGNQHSKMVNMKSSDTWGKKICLRSPIGCIKLNTYTLSSWWLAILFVYTEKIVLGCQVFLEVHLLIRSGILFYHWNMVASIFGLVYIQFSLVCFLDLVLYLEEESCKVYPVDTAQV